MTVHPSSKINSKQPGRQLKAHKKSRGGCGNCKLRKVKCDESKPSCKQCTEYRTRCIYNGKYGELQPLAFGTSKFDTQVIQQSPCSEIQTILSFVNTESANGGHHYHFNVHDLELMHNFKTRTIHTLVQLGGKHGSQLYQNAYSKLAYSHPFLMHIILTLTMNHNQYLLPASSKPNPAIAYHYSVGASLLNAKLSSKTLLPSERDALWAAAGVLGAITFSSLSATTPSQAWPLKPSAPSDLDWLKMTAGKKAIWKIADPMREDSIFYPHGCDFLKFDSAAMAITADLRSLPVELLRLCGFDAADSMVVHSGMLSDDGEDHNPYRAPVTFLASTIAVPCTTANIGLFLGFFGAMTPAYKALLQRKDPCAMLLLGLWYTKLCECMLWWSWRRARLEGRAICGYLKGRYGGVGREADRDADVMAVVRWIEGRLPVEDVV